MIFPELQTNRLILRAIQPDDYARLRFLFSDFDVARMTASFPHPITDDWARGFVTRNHSNDLNKDVVWAIDNGTGFIGSIGAHEIGETASLGYALGKYYWGRGYMTEAVQAVVNYLKTERCVDNVEACVFFGESCVISRSFEERVHTNHCLRSLLCLQRNGRSRSSGIQVGFSAVR